MTDDGKEGSMCINNYRMSTPRISHSSITKRTVPRKHPNAIYGKRNGGINAKSPKLIENVLCMAMIFNVWNSCGGIVNR